MSSISPLPPNFAHSEVVPYKNNKKETRMEKYLKKLLEILWPEFRHPHAPFLKSTFHASRIDDIVRLHDFLAGGRFAPEAPLQRPHCPICVPNSVSACRFEYKKGMVDYIANFGHEFEGPPCSYAPSILEAVANYCERVLENDPSRN